MIRTPDNELDWLRISSELYQHHDESSPKEQCLNQRELKIFNDVTTVDNPINRETIVGSNKTIRDYKINKINNKKMKRKYCIILPNERMYWDFLCMVAIIIVIFLLPFDIAFSLQSDFLNDFNYFTVALFSLDMMINFNTAFIDKGEIIDDRKIIARDYFKLWFWIDLVSTFPVDMIVESQAQVDEGSQPQKQQSSNVQLLRFVRFIRFMKVIKVVRVLKLRVLLSKFQEQFNFTKSLLTLIDLFVLITVLLYISHLFGCIWRFLALQEEQAGAYSWLQYYQIEDQGWFDVYIYSFYWAAITMTTVGYGDVVPVTNNEKMFGIVVMLLSCCIFAFVMNSIGTIFVNLDQNQKLIRFKMGNATKFLNRSDLKQELYGRVKLFLEFKYENEYDHINELEALSILSEGLRQEVVGQVHIQKLLNAKIETSYKQIILNLASKLEEQTFGPEECIFQEGTLGQDLYFLNQGEVLIGIKSCTTYLATLKVGSTFGEVSFFTDIPRTASIYTLGFVQVSKISRNYFLDSFKGGLSKSKQQYFMDKHIVEFQGSFKSFNQTCFSCKSDSHYAIKCPQVHYYVDLKRKIKLIEKLREKQTLFRQQFKRKNKVRYNARRWMKMTQTVVEEILFVVGHIDYEQFDFKLYTLNQILDEFHLHMEEDDMDSVYAMDTYFPLYNSDKIATEYNQDIQKYY